MNYVVIMSGFTWFDDYSYGPYELSWCRNHPRGEDYFRTECALTRGHDLQAMRVHL